MIFSKISLLFQKVKKQNFSEVVRCYKTVLAFLSLFWGLRFWGFNERITNKTVLEEWIFPEKEKLRVIFPIMSSDGLWKLSCVCWKMRFVVSVPRNWEKKWKNDKSFRQKMWVANSSNFYFFDFHLLKTSLIVSKINGIFVPATFFEDRVYAKVLCFRKTDFR